MIRKTKVSLSIARVIGVFREDKLTPEFINPDGNWHYVLLPWQELFWGYLRERVCSQADFQREYFCDFAPDGSEDKSVCLQVSYSRRLGKSFIENRWDVPKGRNK